MADRTGVVLEGTPICVDRWCRTDGAHLFFLTHAHTDHTVGLTALWNLGTIYCTKITAALITRKIGVDPGRIVILEVGSVYSIGLDHTQGERGGVTAKVTVFDANHCPGAAMFLFEGWVVGACAPYAC